MDVRNARQGNDTLSSIKLSDMPRVQDLELEVAIPSLKRDYKSMSAMVHVQWRL